MNESGYPSPAPGKPLWLITLADLALLLVGFFVLLQAGQHSDPRALAASLRQRFATAAEAAAPIPVMAAGMLDFAPGSAALPEDPAALIAWAREAVRDPRVSLTITGSVDGSAADVDRATASAAILAADRARAVAAVLVAVAPRRIVITTATRPGRRAAMVTLAFAGETKEAP
nr:MULTISPECIES: flagellar motor protein MotB [unclassified Sphingomonas]